jgi:hypothetical protein
VYACNGGHGLKESRAFQKDEAATHLIDDYASDGQSEDKGGAALYDDGSDWLPM